jgi:hypothetical protein
MQYVDHAIAMPEYCTRLRMQSKGKPGFERDLHKTLKNKPFSTFNTIKPGSACSLHWRHANEIIRNQIRLQGCSPLRWEKVDRHLSYDVRRSSHDRLGRFVARCARAGSHAFDRQDLPGFRDD